MEFRDLKKQYQNYKVEIDQAIQNVLNKGDFISGKHVDILEKRLADYVGVKHCITCANGTDALSLVLMAWGIGKGHAVFVPNFTFFATAEVVSYCGATPIFVDVDQDTFNIDTNKLERAILRVIEAEQLEPKAIIPVDLFGLPADFLELERLAKKYELKILDDAAQGFGGSIDGKMVGSFGDAATTSFFPAKPLGCYGDGGAIFTDDDKLADLINSYKVHGKGSDKYDNVRIGVNSRLDTIQAAILNVKLTAFIEHELDDVNETFKLYTEKLKEIVKTPIIPDGYKSSFAQYTITLNSKEVRDKLQSKLRDHGIPSMIYYTKTMHQQEAFKDLYSSDEDLEVSTSLCDRVLSLPMHPYLSLKDVENIISVIESVLK